MTTSKFFTVLAGIVSVLALAVYLFGIPPEVKRKLERSALKTMGENKLSYIAKDQISKIPASDQENVKDLKKGLGNAVGGLASNPLGEATGEAADSLTSPLTGR
ncbi:hypothetical protein DPSP01_011341 [Paraphaeosphaeria sporulosa]|uniref:Uncharacterized protein n=1 Tax=Paraphaeosphaeria sporulosa TaxID=1460663 RepID=A0A177CNZ3_9PLEO|nr:uncharacterized protein CC84DRAFT_1162582 [Paraphaeosphaeria sporulosa]OAG08702.1 hypothetical protein CC84DRAFT_1162582 [Paraphaeosphaeria sporulosa]